MSKQTIVENNGQQAHITTDTSKIFIWNPRTTDANYTNNSGGQKVLLAGTLFGRISATEILLPLVTGAADGSQFPLGILMHDITVEDTESAVLTIAVSGDVAEEQLIIDAGDDLSDVISGRTLRDRIGSDTVGIQLVTRDELTGVDNS
jgi:hypothetical protein